MALIESGIKLQMQGSSEFLSEGKKVDELLNKMAASAMNTVDALNKLPSALKNIRIPKSINNIDVSGIDALIKSVNRLDKEIDTTGLTGIANDVKVAIAPVTGLANAINRLTKNQNAINSLGDNLNKIIDSFRNVDISGIQKIVDSLFQLTSAAKEINKAMVIVNRRTLELGKDAGIAGIRFGEFAQGLRNSTSGLNKWTLQVRSSIRVIQRLIDIVRASARIIITLRTTIFTVSKAFQILRDVGTSSFKGLGSAIKLVLNPLETLRRLIRAILNPLETLSKILSGLNNILNIFASRSRVGVGGLRKYSRAAIIAAKNTKILSTSLNTLSNAVNLNILFQQITGAITRFVSIGFDAAAQFEQLTLSIQNLTARELFDTGQFDTLKDAFNSAEEPAQELLKTIRTIAILSPFNANDIAQTFKLAQVYGFTRDNALAVTQAITDFTAATGQSGEVGEGIIRALGQISANTKVAKEELNQLAERGLNATAILAKEFGITVKEVLDLTSRGLIPADRAINAIVKTLQRDFGGAAKNATKTLAGLRSTLQDLGTNALRELTTGAFEAIGEVVSQFTTVENIFGLLDNVRAIGERFGKQIAQALQQVLNVGKILIEIWKALPQPIQNGLATLGQIAVTVGVVTIAVGGLSAAFTALGFLFSTFVGTSGLLIASITALVSVFTSSTTAATQTTNAITQLKDAVAFLILDLDNAIEVFNDIFAAASQEGINIAELSELPDLLKNIASAGANVVILFNEIIDAIVLAETPFQALNNLLGLLPEKFAMVGQSILNATSFIDAFRIIVSTLPQTLQNIINSVIDFASQFTGTFTSVQNFIKDGVQNIIDFLSSAFGAFVDWGANIIVQLANGIRSAVGLVIDAINFIGSVITDLLAPGSPPKILPDLPDWGKNVADQFLSGLSLGDFSLIDNFGNTVSDIFSQIGVDEINLQGVSQAFAEGLNQLGDTGNVDISILEEISNLSGVASAEVEALATEYFKLAEAQDRLNSLTEDYDNQLRDVSDSLKEIENTQAFEDEQKQLDEINRRLNNRFLSEEQRIALERKRDKILATQQAREIQAKKELAQRDVKDAEDNIKRTEERVKLAEQFIKEEEKLASNADSERAKRERKERKKKKKEINALNELAERLFGDGPTGIDLAFDASSLNNAKEQANEAVEGIKNRFQNFFDTISERFKKISDFFSIEGIKGKIDALKLKFGELQTSVSEAFFVGRSTELSSAIEKLDFTSITSSLESVSMLIGSISRLIQTEFNFGKLLTFDTAIDISDFSTLEDTLRSISRIAGSVTESLKGIFTFESDEDNAIAGFVSNIQSIDFSVIGQTLETSVLPVIKDIATGIGDLFTNLANTENLDSLKTLAGVLGDIALVIFSIIVGIGKITAAIGGPLGNAITLVFGTAVTILAGIRDTIVNVAKIIGGIFTLNLDLITQGFLGLGSTLFSVALSIQQTFSGINTAIGDAFSNLFVLIAEFLGFDVSEFSGKISETLGDLVSSLAGVFLILKNFVSQFSGPFAKVTDTVKSFGTAISTAFANLVSRSPFLQKLVKIFTLVGEKVTMLVTKLQPLTKAFAKVFTTIGKLIPFTGALSKGFSFFLGPAGAVITILGLLSTLWFNNIAGIGDFVTRIGELASELEFSFSGITTFVGGVLTEVSTLIGNLFSNLLNISFDDIFNFFTDEGAFDRLLVLGTTIIGLIPLFGSFSGVIASVGAAIPLLLNPIGLLIGAIGLLTVAWTQNWFGIQEITETAITAISDFLSSFSFGQALLDIGTNLTTGVIDIFVGLKDAIVGIFTGDFEAVKEGLQTALDGLTTIFTTWFTLIPTLALGFTNDILSFLGFEEISFSDILPEWLVNFSISDLTALLPEAWTNLSFSDLLPDALKLGSTIAQNPVAFADFALERFLPDSLKNFSVKSVAEALPQEFRDFSLDKLLDETQIGDSTLGEKIGEILDFNIPGTGATAADAFNVIVEGIDKVKDAFVFTLDNPFEALEKVLVAISDTLSKIADVYKAISDSFATELPNPIAEALSLATEGIAASLETISRLIETVRAAFAGELADPFKAITFSLKPITEFFDTVQEKLQNLKSAFSTFELPEIPNPFSGISQGFTSLTDSIGLTDSEAEIDISPKVNVDETSLSDSGKKIASDLIEAFDNQIVSDSIDIRGFSDNIERAVAAVDTTQISVLAQETGLELSEGVLTGLQSGEITPEVATFMTALVDAIKTEGQISSPSQLTFDEAGIPLGEGIIDGIIDALMVGSERIKTALQTLFTGLTSASDDNFIGTFLNVEEQVMAFTEFRELASVELSDMVKASLDTLQEFNEEAMEIIEEFVEDAIESFEELIDFILGDFVDALNELLKVLEDMVNRGKAAIKDFVEGAEDELEKLIDVFERIGGQAVEGLIDALDSLGSKAVQEINTQIDEIINTFQADAVNPVGAPFFVLGDNLGTQLAAGIIAGIEGSAFGITNAIVNEIKKAINDAQTRLGIASPSKFSKVELGVPVGQGVPSGVSETGPQMTQSLIDTITSSLTKARKPVMQNMTAFKNAINSEIAGINAGTINIPNIQPTFNVDSIRQPINSQQVRALQSNLPDRQSALSSTQVSNMNTSNVSNSTATTNNFSMTVNTDNNGAGKVRRNFRRMKMRTAIR